MKLPRFVPDGISKDPEPFIPGPYSMRRKRVKLRTPEAVTRRRKYKANKPKKKRIHCEQCTLRFTPKRSTAVFCSDGCRQKSNRIEWKLFRRFGLANYWNDLNDDFKANNSRIEYLRRLLTMKLCGYLD